MRLSTIPTFLVLLVVLSACGAEQKGAAPGPATSSTLHVRAAGMVKSLGIT